MQNVTNMPVDGEQMTVVDASAELVQQRDQGANWFFWVAGLSLINLVILLLDFGFYFPIGMAASELPLYLFDLPVALLISAAALGLFVLFGLLARRGMLAAFVIGVLVYAADGVLMWVEFEDFIGVGLHLFVLWSLFGGLRAQMQLNRVRRTA